MPRPVSSHLPTMGLRDAASLLLRHAPGGRSAAGHVRKAPQVAAASGRTHHANVTFNGRPDSRVNGMAFEITDAELATADRYEQLAAYVRIAARLASGKEAWVYVDARSAPGGS